MPLTPGTRLGPYEILSAIGAGGMGEVYKARDTRLDRTVAIKILPEAFAADADRVARFQREAKTLAALNHPNIAQIFGLEQAGDVHALAMEFVAGEDLSDRIARGPIPIDEALPIAKQIADALEAAHEQGIIHRDLKPANIKVREDGTVKVLDFGLAKAMDPPTSSPNVSQSPTITTPAMTQAGIILGTAAYMSPEQAKGRPAEKRSDVWAFGCVLYEMLTGKRVFHGEDVSDTLASVLRSDPDWSALSNDVPVPVVALLRRCLERDRSRRLSNISTVSFVVDEVARRDWEIPSKAPDVRTRRIPWLPSAVAVALVAVTAALTWSVRPTGRPGAVTRFALVLPDGQAWPNSGNRLVAISPDGANVVYVNNQQLYLRNMTELDARPIQGTAQGAEMPFFSPDGTSIGFYASTERKIKKIALAGGTAVTICDADNLLGATWAPNGLIVFGQFGSVGRRGIFRVSAAGGKPESVFTPQDLPTGTEIPDAPQLLPNGDDLLFTIAASRSTTGWDRAQIVVQSLTSGRRKVVVDGGSDAHYLPTGHLLYATGVTVMAVPFDVKRLQVTGGPVPVIEGVRRAPAGTTGAAQYSVADTGSLIYVPGPQTAAPLTLTLVDRAGRRKPLGIPPGPYGQPRVSPNGRQLAFHTDDGNDRAIWIYDLSGEAPMRRLTFTGHNDRAVWTLDGERLIFRSDREGDSGLYWQRADGSGSAERVARPEQGTALQPEALSPDGKTLTLSVSRGADRSLATLQLGGANQKPTPLLPAYSSNSSVSRDGKWLAYFSNDSGRDALYVQPLPPNGTKYQVPQIDARDPLWSPDGHELFYLQRKGSTAWQMFTVPVRTTSGFQFENPTALPIADIVGSGPRAYDVTPDGKFFVLLFVSGSGDRDKPTVDSINMTLNWFQELKRRVPLR